MDEVSLSRLNELHPKIRQDAIRAYNKAVRTTPKGVHPYITSTRRTFDEQAELYAQGRSTPGIIVTKSKPGQSYHNYALSLDFCLKIDGKISWEVDNNWMIVVNCFMDEGFFWGGEFVGKFRDAPHFEKRLGHNWRDLLVMYNNNKFIPGTNFVDI